MYDIAIIGGGVVGCAAAYELSRYKLRTLLLEAANDIADVTTKANSAIIHAGYDPEPGTAMARLNVEGAALAEEICKKLDVPYNKCGAFVLAFDEADLAHVQKLYEQGVANGVPGIAVISGEEAKRMEPNLSDKVIGALYAPSSAIISPWEYALAMAETAVRNGVDIRTSSRVTAIKKVENQFEIQTSSGNYRAKYIINAAGVHSAEVHELIGEKEFEIHPVRGQYFLLDKSEGSRVTRTIFQCPTAAGKGVLVSPTVHGNLIVGPDAEPVSDGDDVSTTAEGLEYVKLMSQKSVPSTSFRDNIRNFSGIRSQSDRSDFIIEESHSVKNFFNLAGIKSPGLSAAPAIAKEAVKLLTGAGLELTEKSSFIDERKQIRFKELTDDEKNRLIAKDPLYGRVICRCETITEGEIVAALRSPIPPCSVDGIKRRTGAGMGRCQGGFCGPRVLEIIARELGIPRTSVLKDKSGTYILVGETKGGTGNV